MAARPSNTTLPSVILIVKPWNPWPRSFRTIWDAIEERRRVVRGNVTQSLITPTSTAIPIYLSLGRNIFHYHSSRYHSNGPVEGLAHYLTMSSDTISMDPFTMLLPDLFAELISRFHLLCLHLIPLMNSYLSIVQRVNFSMA